LVLDARLTLKLSAISLFSGLGGLDYGFEAANYKTLIAVDSDRVCREVIRRNRRWAVLEVEAPNGTTSGDLSLISSRQLLQEARLRRRDLDVLMSGPPCQPFSKAGYWANGDSPRLKDPRANTLKEFLRVLRDTLPRVFVLENVPGFAFAGKREGLDLLLRALNDINKQCGTSYRAVVKVLNAADYGVPQIRHRLFVVGCRDGREFVFPERTHGPLSGGTKRQVSAYRTAWDAFAGLPEMLDAPDLMVGGKWGDLLPSIPEGKNYLWHTPKGGGKPIFGWRTRYWSFLLKLAKGRPAWTIPAEPGTATGPFHWKNRRLSIAEMCRLQTLPRPLIMDISYRDAQRLIGNAVPSLLAEVLALEIREQLFESKKRCGRNSFVSTNRRSIASPEPVSRVPKKYLMMVGDHAPHPGPGLGPLYSAQKIQRGIGHYR